MISGFTLLILNKEDLEFIPQFLCLLGHPVNSKFLIVVLPIFKSQLDIENEFQKNFMNFRVFSERRFNIDWGFSFFFYLFLKNSKTISRFKRWQNYYLENPKNFITLL